MSMSKTDPSSWASSPSSNLSRSAKGRRACGLLLVLLGAALPARGLGRLSRIAPQFGSVTVIGADDARISRQLGAAVRAVQKRFEEEREKLPILEGAGGEKVYPLPAAISLIETTASDLDRRIAKLKKPDLDALRAWADLELLRLRREAEAFRSAPEPVRGAAAPEVEEAASRASLRRPDLATVRGERGALRPRLAVARRGEEVSGARAASAGASEAGVPTGLVNRVLDILGRILVVAEKGPLRIDVEVTILPEQRSGLVVFPPVDLALTGKRKRPGKRPTGGRLVGLSRGIYLYSFDPGPIPGLACPRSPKEAWDSCYLDLMYFDGPILCHLEPRAGHEPGCCIAAKESCER